MLAYQSLGLEWQRRWTTKKSTWWDSCPLNVISFALSEHSSSRCVTRNGMLSQTLIAKNEYLENCRETGVDMVVVGATKACSRSQSVWNTNHHHHGIRYITLLKHFWLPIYRCLKEAPPQYDDRWSAAVLGPFVYSRIFVWHRERERASAVTILERSGIWGTEVKFKVSVRRVRTYRLYQGHIGTQHSVSST